MMEQQPKSDEYKWDLQEVREAFIKARAQVFALREKRLRPTADSYIKAFEEGTLPETYHPFAKFLIRVTTERAQETNLPQH